MSGPRDTRETAEAAGTSGVPADSAPPSFGGTAPPAGAPPVSTDAGTDAGTGAGSSAGEAAEQAASKAAGKAAGETESAAEAASFRLPTYGLEAPWWAAESADTAPPAEPPAPAQNTAAATAPAAAPETAEPEATEDAPAQHTGGQAAAAPTPVAQPPGRLVAGAGVPSVDSRRAVPAEPIVKSPVTGDDTDPDGFQAVRPEGGAPEDETAEDDTTVDNSAVNETAEGSPAPVSAFEKAKEAENASAQTAVLVPDAILPRGVVPPTGSGPFPHPETADGATAPQAAVIAPVYHAEGGVPLDTPPPPGQPPQPSRPPQGGGRGNRRRTLLIGGGAAVVLAAAIALFTIGGTKSGDDGGEGDKRGAPEPSAAAPAPSAPATKPPAAAPVNIADEKTDTRDLTFRDVFPQPTLSLGGRTYTRDRWSLNRDVRYAARGSMLRTLEQQQCRKIIRATYIDRKSGLAVTSGIAVMPTKAAATTVSKAGDPAAYEWFRGMAGKHSPDIDRAGGYAAATVRGRYVAYAYVQWANGKKAKPGDQLIKQAAQRFIDYDLRPIMARARS
ncbi:hypothetical protein [Actinomadura sp. GTD37]|uniref:hypothetical protein n=1 Tax=Actinomadura sp. GTD37 TaxID=1778030 RepID=UPI0035BFF01C